MIEEPSLQALIDISNHPTLSKRLTEVIISNAQYGGGGSPNPQSTTDSALLSGGYAHHGMLTSSGQARDMLVEAFNKVGTDRGLRDFGSS